MGELDAQFGELRALLQRPPSVERWRQLVEMLFSWPDTRHREEVAAPYAEGRLRDWPVEVRCIEDAWSWRVAPDDARWLYHLIRHLEIDEGRLEMLRALGQQGAFRNARALTLRGLSRRPDLMIEALEDVFSWLERRLTSLALRGCFFNAEAAALILGAPQCEALESLTLRNAYKPSVTNLLASTPRFESVRHLDMRGDLLRAEDLLMLMETPLFDGLRSLTVGALLDARGPSAEPVVYALAGALDRSEVTHLGLYNMQLTFEGARAIARSEWARRVRVLDLPGTLLDTLIAIELFGEASHFEALTHLRLRSWNLGSGALQVLTTSPRAEHLTHLHMTGCSLREDEVCDLFGADFWGAKLEHLAISDATLGQRAAEAIARSDHLERLRSVAMVNCFFEHPAALEAIASAPWIGQLEALDLHSAWGEETPAVEAALGHLRGKIPRLYLDPGSSSESLLELDLPSP